MTKDQAITWLQELVRYFENRATTTNEDREFWASQKNAENAEKIILLIKENI